MESQSRQVTRQILSQLFSLHQGSTPERQPDGKLVTGYCEPLSLRAGEEVQWFGSSHVPTSGVLDIVRLVCGDPTRSGPGFLEHDLETFSSLNIDLTEQPLVPGSYAEAQIPGVQPNKLSVSFWFQPTLLKRDGVIASLHSTGAEIEILNRGEHLYGRLGSTELRLRERPLERHRWYWFVFKFDFEKAVCEASVTAPESASPGRDLLQSGEERNEWDLPHLEFENIVFRLAAGVNGERWDGRIAEPRICVDNDCYQWSFAEEMETNSLPAVNGNADLKLHQLPTRAVTGPEWNGAHQRWSDDPGQWNAVHFHHDDLYDAAWEPTLTLQLPDDLPSGIYCFRYQGEAGTDRVPFFVRPSVNATHSDIALLMPTCTYMAYANHRMLIEGADFVGARNNLRPEHQYLAEHREVGLSHYEKHPDGSGVMFSSRRRPVLQLRPGADGWNFTPDTDLNAFLSHLQLDHDIVSDEDVHVEGRLALAPYRVIVTGTHPEYWSSAMLDALEAWQRDGGRLMYLGGNGLNCEVEFVDEGTMIVQNGDLRRQRDEGYESRFHLREESEANLLGVVFTEAGIMTAAPYEVMDDDHWAFVGTGLSNEDIFGEECLHMRIPGGASGHETDKISDKYSPKNVELLARGTNADGGGADMVVHEPDGGGAVFSSGSITYISSLLVCDNVSRVTANVVRRFLQ